MWPLHVTFIKLIFTSEIIIQLFSRDLKLSILSNHAKYSKRLVPWYVLPPFTILKSLYPTGQPAHLEKMTLIQRRGHLIWRSQASEALTGPSSNKFNDGDYKDSLGSNQPGLFEASTETPVGPSQTPPPTSQDIDTNRYSQQDLDRIIQTFFYVSKDKFSGNKLKVKTPNIYRGRSHM